MDINIVIKADVSGVIIIRRKVIWIIGGRREVGMVNWVEIQPTSEVIGVGIGTHDEKVGREKICFGVDGLLGFYYRQREREREREREVTKKLMGVEI